MDHYAWMILQRSTGNLEYGIEFNREVAKIASPKRISVLIERILRIITDRFEHNKETFPSTAAPRDEKGCHAC